MPITELSEEIAGQDDEDEDDNFEPDEVDDQSPADEWNQTPRRQVFRSADSIIVAGNTGETEVRRRTAMSLNDTTFMKRSVSYSIETQHRCVGFRDSITNRLRASFSRQSGRGGGEARTRVTSSVHRHGNTSVHIQLNSVSQIDRVSRVIFPIAFILMNFVYWFVYLRAERNIDLKLKS